MGKNYKNKEIMHNLYVVKGLSMPDIADKLECSYSTVNRWIHKHGIESRKSNREKYHSITVDKRGYEIITLNNKKVQLHRLLAVSEHGIDSIDGMEVHHKNEIPWDNRVENIQLLTPEEHSKITRKSERKTLEEDQNSTT